MVVPLPGPDEPSAGAAIEPDPDRVAPPGQAGAPGGHGRGPAAGRAARAPAAATSPIRCRSAVSAALRSMCGVFTRATSHSHQSGHLVTWNDCTIRVPVPVRLEADAPVGAVDEQPGGNRAPGDLVRGVDDQDLAGPAPAQPARAVAPAEPDPGRRPGRPVEPGDVVALVAPLARAGHVGDDPPHRFDRRVDGHLDAARTGQTVASSYPCPPPSCSRSGTSDLGRGAAGRSHRPAMSRTAAPSIRAGR